MQPRASFRRALTLVLFLAVLPAAPAVAGEVIGRVVSIDGDVFAEAPGEEPRRLRCGDPVRREDTVTTTFGGRVGILVGSVHARLGDGTQTRFDLTSEGAPAFFVTMGRLHVIDAREADAPRLRIATPDLEARAAGSDTDLWVGDPESPAVTTLCESGADLHVTLGDGTRVVTSPGQCSELGAAGGFAKHPRELRPLGGAGEPCTDLLGPLTLHLRDPGRIEPPIPLSFPDPRPVPDPPRGPCDDPGSGCVFVPTASPPTAAPVPPVVEQPVVGCQIPGLCVPAP